MRWRGPDPHAVLLATAVVATYAVSLGGGFLNYDDPWLVAGNPILRLPAVEALPLIWGDFTEATRFTLGAEFLPVRDTVHWLEVGVAGWGPQALRTVNLLLYLAAGLLVRGYLIRALGAGLLAEAAALLFALHPVHAESVAWIAGRKDVLALFFVAAALWTYAGAWRGRALLVPLLVLAACLSKAIALVTPVLLLMHDGWARRRPAWAALAGAAVAAGFAAAIHGRVGAVVGMIAAWPGGSRLATAATMGPVWIRYLGHSFWPVALSVAYDLGYDVPVRGAASLVGWASYGLLAAFLTSAIIWWRRTGGRLPLLALGLFGVALLPTSQVVAPLQNVMADRYLVLAVLGPCLMVAAVLAGLRVSTRARLGAVFACAALFAGLTADRALAFADSVRLWSDTTAKSQAPRAAYQLGLALNERGDLPGAASALRLAIGRAEPNDDIGRAARNNLASVLAAQGNLAHAEVVLRENVRLFPRDPKALNNLAEITARRGDHESARRLFEDLVNRFPHYRPGRQNLEKRYGRREPAR